MKEQSSESIAVKLIKEAVESEGCRLEEVDFDRLTIRVDGPEKVVSDCARAVEEVFD